jgi:hypothetical protein
MFFEETTNWQKDCQQQSETKQFAFNNSKNQIKIGLS